MKKLATILLLLSALAGYGQERIELLLSVTNTPVTGDTLTINGDTRTWTNAHSSSTILTNLATIAINNSMTNLFFNVSAYPYSDRPVALKTRTNQIRFIFPVGVAVTASEAGDWAEFTLSTNAITTTYTVRVPLTTEAETNRTNIASMLVTGLQYSTNPIVTHWSIASQLAGLTNNNAFTGTNSLTRGGWNNASITNLLSLSGIISSITNGYWTNGVLDDATVTKLTVYTELTSPGSGLFSEQFGATANASGGSTLAIGYGAVASATNGIAIGRGASATAKDDLIIGRAAEGGGGKNIVIGNASAASKTNGLIFGNNSINDYTNTVLIGNDATASGHNQIQLGDSSHLTVIPGRLQVSGTVSNTTLTAATKIGVSGGPYGTLSISRRDVASMAPGANSLDIAGSSYVKVSGALAAFSIDGITNSASGNLNGNIVIIENLSGDTMTIAHQSGLESTAANRIRTTSGFGETFGANGIAQLIYDSGASRWILMNRALNDPVFGQIYANGATVADPLATAGTYYQLTNLQSAGFSSGVTLDESNSRIQILSEGYYDVEYDVSFSGTANTVFTLSIFTNGVAAANTRTENALDASGSIAEMGRSAPLYLPTNSIVDLRATADGNTKTMTTKYGGITIEKLK